jgi:hypothetical protein
MRVGDRFLLSLGEGYDWTVAPADPSIVSQVSNVPAASGSQGVYEARKPGQTELGATGDPLCRKSRPPCGMPSRAFRIEVVVQ